MVTSTSSGPRLASILQQSSDQEPQRQKARDSCHHPIFLPRPCLVTTFFFLLHKRKEQEQDIPRSFDHCIRFVLHFGMVSCSFRNHSLESVSEFLSSSNVCFSCPSNESALLWFHHKLPSSFQPELMIETLPNSLPKAFNVTALSVVCYDELSVLDLCIFFRENDLTLIQKFATSTEIGPNTCEIITDQMPLLRVLSIQRLSFSNVGGSFNFPKTLSKLAYLDCRVSASTYDSNILNVSALTSLNTFICFGMAGTSIQGLPCLDKLENLTLVDILSSDDLHFQAKLKQITLHYVPIEVLEPILSQREIVSEARLEIFSIQAIPDSVSWIFDSILTSLSFEENFHGSSFSSHDFPFLETLKLEDVSSLVLGDLRRLNKCTFKSLLNNVEISSTLYLSELQVDEIAFNILLHLLSKTPMLRCLKVEEIEDIDEVTDIPRIDLPYLSLLQISGSGDNYNAEVFLKIIPPLQRLSRLHLSTFSNLDSKLFNSYPRLQTLILEECSIVGKLSRPNTTVRILKVTASSSTPSFDCPDFLADLLAVEHLTLELKRESMLFDCLLLPPNVRFLSCHAPYEVMCSSLLASTKLEKVSGILRVKGNIERAQKWLDHFNSRRDLFSSLVLHMERAISV
ncbi:hypothetical protein RCL1_008765 [Eukaryota sp. TZLM3-RCL]